MKARMHAMRLALAALAAIVPPVRAVAQARPAEVRQLVTFLFLPGMADSARGLYTRMLRPVYEADTAMRRFRAYQEAESPEPMDLMVVSSFDGMAGMDASNAALRGLSSGGRTTFQWYGALSALSQYHRDEFVEMLSPAVDVEAPLLVVERIRVAPGAQRSWERAIAALPAGPVVSETGRVLVGNGWDYVRFHAIRRLADWQAYRARVTAGMAGARLARLEAARSVTILRRDDALSVR